ncbi:MAG TPA: hypothetical protein VM536_16385 [Chloroflexia bacterium]|nr:hypothetical protein [Chloroflexia bacterium]
MTDRPSVTQERPSSDTFPSSTNPNDNDLADVLAAGLDTDATYSYGLDGFTPGHIEKCGATDPQDAINLEDLAEQIFMLLRREAYIERERLGGTR